MAGNLADHHPCFYAFFSMARKWILVLPYLVKSTSHSAIDQQEPSSDPGQWKSLRLSWKKLVPGQYHQYQQAWGRVLGTEDGPCAFFFLVTGECVLWVVILYGHWVLLRVCDECVAPSSFWLRMGPVLSF